MTGASRSGEEEEASREVRPGELPAGLPLFDNDGALSREFLLHRGYCCENGCRNCPYGFVPQTSSLDSRQPQPD